MKVLYLVAGLAFLGLFLLVKSVGAFTTSPGKPSLPTGTAGVPYSDYIMMSSRTWGVPSALIKAVIRQESNFNPNAINPERTGFKSDDSYGIMQVGLMTAQDFGLVKDYTKPTEYEIGNLMKVENNINTGTRKLSAFLQRYPLDIAIQMYNVGEAGYNSGHRAADYLARVKGFYDEYKI